MAEDQLFPDPYVQPGVSNNRDLDFGVEGVASVDLFTGMLNISQTDMVMKGVGPDISVVRNYHSSPFPRDLVGGRVFNGKNSFAFGWDMHFGRIIDNGTSFWEGCLKLNEFTHLNPFLELQDGSTHKLYSPLANLDIPHDLVSDNGWVVDCIHDTQKVGFIATDSSGTKYRFDRYGTFRLRVGVGDKPAKGWMLSKITDIHNNSVTLTYKDWQLTDNDELTTIAFISTSDGRFLDFNHTFNGSGNIRLESISSGWEGVDKEVWHYDYTVSAGVVAPDGYSMLSGVRGPEGLRWKYEYWAEGIAKYNLESVTAPYGGIEKYEYEIRDVPKAITTSLGFMPKTIAVGKKIIEGPAVETGVWKYDYILEGNSIFDVVKVEGPYSTEQHFFCGSRTQTIEAELNACFGMAGALVRKEIYSKDAFTPLLMQEEKLFWVNVGHGSQKEFPRGEGHDVHFFHKHHVEYWLVR